MMNIEESEEIFEGELWPAVAESGYGRACETETVVIVVASGGYQRLRRRNTKF